MRHDDVTTVPLPAWANRPIGPYPGRMPLAGLQIDETQPGMDVQISEVGGPEISPDIFRAPEDRRKRYETPSLGGTLDEYMPAPESVWGRERQKAVAASMIGASLLTLLLVFGPSLRLGFLPALHSAGEGWKYGPGIPITFGLPGAWVAALCFAGESPRGAFWRGVAAAGIHAAISFAVFALWRTAPDEPQGFFVLFVHLFLGWLWAPFTRGYMESRKGP